jgi:hypothetical protein
MDCKKCGNVKRDEPLDGIPAAHQESRFYREVKPVPIHIVNHKRLQVKSHLHEVTDAGWLRFKVTSGTSGREYTVSLLPFYDDDGKVREIHASCSCDWGTAGGLTLKEASGCSHVQEAVGYWTGRRMSAWGDADDALRQHRPVYDIKDNVLLTGRAPDAAEILADGRALLRGDVDYEDLI